MTPAITEKIFDALALWYSLGIVTHDTFNQVDTMPYLIREEQLDSKDPRYNLQKEITIKYRSFVRENFTLLEQIKKNLPGSNETVESFLAGFDEPFSSLHLKGVVDSFNHLWDCTYKLTPVSREDALVLMFITYLNPQLSGINSEVTPNN